MVKTDGKCDAGFAFEISVPGDIACDDMTAYNVNRPFATAFQVM
jgi:hypothetical protein